MRLEHQVEAARRGERARVVRADELEPLDDGRVGQVGRREALGSGQLVEPIAAMTGRAFDEGVAERADVAGRDPDLGVHEDPGVEPDDVLALLDHRPPPCPLDVVLQLDPERAVVPDGVDAAVDLGGREDEASALREGDDRLEVVDGGRDGIRIGRGGGVGHEGLQWGDRPWQGRSRDRWRRDTVPHGRPMRSVGRCAPLMGVRSPLAPVLPAAFTSTTLRRPWSRC